MIIVLHTEVNCFSFQNPIKEEINLIIVINKLNLVEIARKILHKRS